MAQAGAYPRDGEYFGQFWGTGVPRFGGGVRQDLQATVGARSGELRPGEWCATWAWTQQPAGNKKLRPAPRASAPLLHIDEAIRRLKEKPSYDAGSVKVKALHARRRVLSAQPFKPEHGPRGFGSSIKTDRGADPRTSTKAGGTGTGKRTPLRSTSESIRRPEFSAPHSYRRREGLHVAVIKKKLGTMQQLKAKVARGEKLTLQEQQQVKPIRPDMLNMWQDPALRRDHKALITNRIDELESELATLESKKNGFGTSQQTYRGTQSPLCPWSSVDPSTLNIRADALKVRAPKTMCPPACANVPIGAKTAVAFDREGQLVSSPAATAEEMGEDMLTTKAFYQFAEGLSEEERVATAQETIRRRALNNLTVLKRKLKAASYTINGNDWSQLFRQADSDGNGCLDSDEFRSMVRRCGIAHITNVELDVLYNAIDVDGSGDITAEEFVSFLTDRTVPIKLDTFTVPNASNLAEEMSGVETSGSNSLATVHVDAEEQAEKENERPSNGHVRFDHEVDLRTMSPADESSEHELQHADHASAAAAVGLVTPAQQELLDYVEDLYEMAALDLITDEELEARKNAVIDELEASVLAGEPHQRVDGTPVPSGSAGAGALQEQRNDAAAVFGRGTEIRAPGPNHTKLYTQRIVARLNLPDPVTCDRLFTRFDHHRVETLSLPGVQSLVADLWQSPPVPTIVERAFRGAELDEARRLHRKGCRDVLKCVIYLDALSETLADISAIEKLTEAAFVDACAAVKEPIAAKDAQAEFRQLRDQDNCVSFDKFCMWLACRNVLDSAATPTLAGPVVVPSGPDLDNDHAASTAQALVSAHEVAEAYASTALRRSGTVGARQQAPRPGSVEKEPSVEFMTPAEVQTDIPELVLGGESCPKVPVRSLQAPKATGTAFDLRNENHAVSWRTDREIEREVAHRQIIERLTQVSNATGTHDHNPAVSRPANALLQQNTAMASRRDQRAVPAEQTMAPAEPIVVDVEPVVLGNTTYLVDKVNGVVYSNIVEPGQEPVVVGRWSAKMPAATAEDEGGQEGTYHKDDNSAVNRWINSGAVGITDSSSKQQSLDAPVKPQSTRTGSGRVQFSSHAHIDVGSVPTVQAEPGSTHTVPLWSAGVSDDVVVSAAASRPARHLKASKSGDKLQYLASHGLQDWPDPNDDQQSRARGPVQVGRYHQKNTRTPTAARPPSPRSPRWDLPVDKQEAGRDLAPSSPRGARRPIEDGIRVLRAVNGTKHTGNSHTPGVTQSRTLPPQERNWAGLTDDPLIMSQRDAANQQVLKEHPPKKLDPAEEAAFNAALAMERRVLASDQQSWAYLSLQRMAEERDLVATNPEHFLVRQQHSTRTEPSVSVANYRLGQRRAQSEKGGRQQRVSISEENNRYSDGGAQTVEN